eukprot:gene148-154_t
MSQMNFPSEDLLWKLGISTLFIFTHRLLVRNNAPPKRKVLESKSQRPTEAPDVTIQDSGSITQTTDQTNNIEQDLSAIYPDSKQDAEILSDISASEIYRSPAAMGATPKHTNAYFTALKSPPVSAVRPILTSTATPNSAESKGTVSSNGEPKIGYEEVMSQNISHHDDEYIQDTFQQTVRLYHEENRSLKKKVEELQTQLSHSSSNHNIFSPFSSTQNQNHLFLNSLSSSPSFTTPYKGEHSNSFTGPMSPSIQYLIEQNQKLTQEKQLLVQSIEYAHNQFQQISQRHHSLHQISSDGEEEDKDNGVKGEDVENLQTIAVGKGGNSSFAPLKDASDIEKDYDEHIYLRLRQILQEIPLMDLNTTFTAANIYDPAQTSFSSPILKPKGSPSPPPSDSSSVLFSPSSSSDLLLQKLTTIQQILTYEYPTMKTKFEQLSNNYDDAINQINDLKSQLSSLKLLKIQEITDLHRKIVELTQFYEQQIQQLKESTATMATSDNGHSSNGKANGSGVRSRSTTPTAIKKKSSNTSTPTPNTEFISLPSSINKIGNTSENSIFITKELAKSFQSPGTAYNDDEDDPTTPLVNSFEGRDVTPGKIRKTTPSKIRNGTPPSVQRHPQSASRSAAKSDVSHGSLNTTTDSINSPNRAAVMNKVKEWETRTKR